jgi:hypothetical protein
VPSTTARTQNNLETLTPQWISGHADGGRRPSTVGAARPSINRLRKGGSVGLKILQGLKRALAPDARDGGMARKLRFSEVS